MRACDPLPKANNFNVMKGPGGVYWMESMESGKNIRSNGILEVADLLDKFKAHLRRGTGSCNRR
jgi:hypothetical protein